MVVNRSTDDRNSPVGAQNAGRDGFYSAAARRTSGWGSLANNPSVLDYIPPSLALNRPRIHTPEGGEVSSPPLSESPDFPTLLGRINGGRKDGSPPEATSPYVPASSPAVYPTHPYDVAALNGQFPFTWHIHIQFPVVFVWDTILSLGLLVFHLPSQMASTVFNVTSSVIHVLD